MFESWGVFRDQLCGCINVPQSKNQKNVGNANTQNRKKDFLCKVNEDAFLMNMMDGF